MNKHKQFHFIPVLLLAFALSLALVPICHAQSDDTAAPAQTEAASVAPTPLPAGLPSVFQAAGPNPIPPNEDQSIQSTVDAFRAAFGGMNNGNTPGPLLSGRREINWDGGGNNDTTDVPVTPFNVFLDTRGGQFTTPGTAVGLAQAVIAGGPQGGLAELFNNASYGFIFSTFSPMRLFTPAGMNITDARFFIPGTNGSAPALVRGFGAVFTDVDRPNGVSNEPSTFIEYYDAQDQLLFRGIVPSSPGTANMSFFGILFDNPVIARVRIITGNSAPGPDDDQEHDIVMMDDFIYGEPQPATP
jgi:hypothetical protein